MRDHGNFKSPEHGLQVEETLARRDVVGVQYLWRYWWAWHVGTGMLASRPDGHAFRVLDGGCGSGYGSRIVSEVAGSVVTGIDADLRAVNAAKGNPDYVDERIAFHRANVEGDWDASTVPALSTPGLDLVLAFEVFELLRHREFFLEQCTRHLADDGVLLLSAGVVNRARCHPNPKDAVFHYDRQTLERLLRRYFREVNFGMQEERGPYFDGYRLKHYYDRVVERACAEDATKKLKPFRVGLDTVYCARPHR